MAGVVFNSTLPISVRDTYTEFNQIDFLVSLKSNSIQKNSFRLNGKLKVFPNGDYTGVADLNSGIFLNAFSGVSSLINVASVSVNSTNTIENIASFGRLVGMKKQAKYTLPQLTASSYASLELCGNRNNQLLLGEVGQDGYISFSLKIDNCLNNSLGGDLHPAVIQELRLMLTMESALNAFHVNRPTSAVTAVSYLLKDLQLNWTEVPAAPKPEPIGMLTYFLTQQTLVSKVSNLSIMTGNLPADSLSISFIKQKNKSNIKRDCNLCEYLGEIERVEFEINSSQSVNMYPLTSYGDIALNYYRSFSEPNMPLEKNSITSLATFGTSCFGVGVQYPESTADKLTMSITIKDDARPENDPATDAIDAYCYVNSMLQL
jgi:hypothetical protein